MLVVGAVNVDVVVSTDELPGPGQSRRRRQRGALRRRQGSDAAVAAARAGAEVQYCGVVGRDDAGSGAVAELRTVGLDVTDVATLDGVSTGTALIVVDRKGENQIARRCRGERRRRSGGSPNGRSAGSWLGGLRTRQC